MKHPTCGKPKILLIHNKYQQTGGEDSVVANELAILQREGYTVFYREFDNHSFSSGGRMTLLLNGINFFFNLPAFFSLVRFIRNNRVDVVHVHNFFYTASPSVFWAGKLAGARTVMSMHNYRLFCLNALFFRDGKTCMDCVQQRSFRQGIVHKCFKASTFFSRILAISTRLHRSAGTWTRKVDRFVVLNPLMKELLTGIGVNAARISIKPNFISDRKYNGYTQRGDYYLFLSRVQEEKGIRHVVEAFKKSGRRLLIAGEGELVDFVRQKEDTNIRYLGQQSSREAEELMLGCRGFIFSSFLTEGMPMTIIEAQAAGAITIACRSVNTQRMIEHGVDGLLYPCGNSDALNEQIDALENLSAEEREAISIQARASFNRMYNEKSHLNAIAEIYSGR